VRSRWEALRSGLMRSIQSRTAIEGFERVKREATAVAPFGEPAAVVGHLAHPGGDLDEKDRVIGELAAVVGRDVEGQIATSILLLGLWPGLDAVFNRKAPLFRGRAGDLGGEIIQRFVAEVHRLDLTRVTRVTATLVRNTERRLLQARVREVAFASKPLDLSSSVVKESSAHLDRPPASPFAGATGRSDVGSVAVLRDWLKAVVGDDDGDLVADAILLGCTRRELAEAMQLSPAAVRKRLQRALLRARHAMDGKDSWSQSLAKPAFVAHDHETRGPALSGFGRAAAPARPLPSMGIRAGTRRQRRVPRRSGGGDQ
jgi:hypothetical protein